MTATRNGRFKRAALRVATVAGFAAAAWIAGSAAAQAAEQSETPSTPATAFGEAHAVGGPAQGVQNTGEDRATPDLVTTLLRVAPELDVQRVATGVDAVLAVPGLLTRPAPDDPDDPAAPIDPREQQPKPHPGPQAACGERDPLLALVRQRLQPARRTVAAIAGPAVAAVPVGVLPQITASAPARVVHIASTVVRAKPEHAVRKATAVRVPTRPSAVDHVPGDGNSPARTPDLDDCAPSTVPAGSSHGGGGAPVVTWTAMAVLTEPMARALRRATDSALRRADAPHPTSSPD